MLGERAEARKDTLEMGVEGGKEGVWVCVTGLGTMGSGFSGCHPQDDLGGLNPPPFSIGSMSA